MMPSGPATDGTEVTCSHEGTINTRPQLAAAQWASFRAVKRWWIRPPPGFCCGLSLVPQRHRRRRRYGEAAAICVDF